MTVEPDLAGFSATYSRGEAQVVWTSMVADLETPVSAMLKLADGKSNAFLLESVEGGAVRGRFSIIGLRPDLVWRFSRDRAEINWRAESEPDAFEPCSEPPMQSLRTVLARSRIALPEGLPPMSSGLFGYMGYDAVRLTENIPDTTHDDLEIPDGIFVRPTLICVFDRLEDVVSIVTPVWPEPGVSANAAYRAARTRIAGVIADFRRGLPAGTSAGSLELGDPVSPTTREEFCDVVERAQDYIRAGDAFQIVPSLRFSVPFPLPSMSLYRSLRRLNPSPFLFFFDFGDFSIVGSSPEILVRLRDEIVTLRPLAGTKPRGETAALDRKMAEELLSDPKERAEHLMLLDLGRNDVGRVSKVGSVRVVEQFVIEYYSHVMHIASHVEGRIRDGLDGLDALAGSFPAGTVSGAPKVRAMEIIDELEKTRRGVYAGAIGYFSAGGAMDTCIALRTALVKDGVMHIQAGCGVVADSDPDTEYEECVNKARALFRAAEEAVKFAASQP